MASQAIAQPVRPALDADETVPVVAPLTAEAACGEVNEILWRAAMTKVLTDQEIAKRFALPAERVASLRQDSFDSCEVMRGTL
ncbi:hypothetical protein [Oceanibacterium hippocampi]|uniref:Uncharacterized protein n=1 Tax=Oceanibacterium hippocampi TaxID=745714 RepID=A0A1Y5TBY0_9PROT|nr:hypothetical protein [Oceanibacterium hippocampi]SLN58431.1 hypothetical protein OCH7691_02573 [Oceanibacterium hippocampi]